MKIRMLASAACAVLMITAVPLSAATVPAAPTPFRMFGPAGGTDVDAFYASRREAPLWLRDGPNSPAARELISILQGAPIDGLASGPELAGRAQALISQASGEPSTLLAADKLLSSAWVQYVQTIQRPPRGMTYADPWVAPKAQSSAEILRIAAAAPSLEAHCAPSRRSILSTHNCATPPSRPERPIRESSVPSNAPAHFPPAAATSSSTRRAPGCGWSKMAASPIR